jgi:hypothetical protein
VLGSSGRRRGLAGELDAFRAELAAAFRRQRRQERARAAGRRLGGAATAPLRAAGGVGAGLGRAPALLLPQRTRRSKMAGNFKLAVGLAAGYVLGTRAGRERYERLAEAARNVADRPEVQQLTGKLRGRLGAGLDKAASGAGDRLQRARSGADGPDRDEQPDRGPAAQSRPEGAPTDAGEGEAEGERRRERSRVVRAARR